MFRFHSTGCCRNVYIGTADGVANDLFHQNYFSIHVRGATLEVTLHRVTAWLVAITTNLIVQQVPQRMKLKLTFLSLLPLIVLQIDAQVGSRPVLTAAPPPAAAQAPAPAASAGHNGASMALSPEYRIGAYDALQVTVWKEQQLSGLFPVRPDGKISLVLLGDVEAAGLTPMQLGDNITESLKKYIQNPLVTVTVTAVNSQKVYVMGQVGKVGPVDLSPGMTPLEAVASAGGLVQFASGKNAYILRGAPGSQKKIPFDYKKALKGKEDHAVTLQTGDTIVIP